MCVNNCDRTQNSSHPCTCCSPIQRWNLFLLWINLVICFDQQNVVKVMLCGCFKRLLLFCPVLSHHVETPCGEKRAASPQQSQPSGWGVTPVSEAPCQTPMAARETPRESSKRTTSWASPGLMSCAQRNGCCFKHRSDSQITETVWLHRDREVGRQALLVSCLGLGKIPER